ncbi:MAG: DNA polymerase domain-containing protein [Candidatus Nanohalobium sp.]
MVLHNSFYGYLGYNGARWYSREAAEATTYMGREYIEETIEMAEEDGYEIVYGDTDSVFLKKDNIKEDIHEFLEKVNSELPEFMELEFEGYFRRGFFTSKDSGEGAKKKYALIGEEGGMKITGFEQVRRDWSPIAKRAQKEVLRKVLEDEVEEAFEVAKKRIEQLKNGEVPIEDLKIYTTLTKPPEEYDSTSPHVEAAKKAKKRGKEIPEESTITYVITSGGGSISEKAEILEYAEDYDAEYYIENQVIPAAMRVLKVFGYTEDQLKGKGKQSGLSRFQ